MADKSIYINGIQAHTFIGELQLYYINGRNAFKTVNKVTKIQVR